LQSLSTVLDDQSQRSISDQRLLSDQRLKDIQSILQNLSTVLSDLSHRSETDPTLQAAQRLKDVQSTLQNLSTVLIDHSQRSNYNHRFLDDPQLNAIESTLHSLSIVLNDNSQRSEDDQILQNIETSLQYFSQAPTDHHDHFPLNLKHEISPDPLIQNSKLQRQSNPHSNGYNFPIISRSEYDHTFQRFTVAMSKMLEEMNSQLDDFSTVKRELVAHKYNPLSDTQETCTVLAKQFEVSQNTILQHLDDSFAHFFNHNLEVSKKLDFSVEF
jgi:hypothetical protein